MTEPEQWAVELAKYVPRPTRLMAAFAIQRAFEERERKLREDLADCADRLIAVIDGDPGPKLEAAYKEARRWWQEYDAREMAQALKDTTHD